MLALAALAWPAVDPTPGDSLPVSNYPMFARPRPAESRFPVVLLGESEASSRRLDPRQISGTDQPMQAAMTVGQAVRNGSADELCAEIAAALDELGSVWIVTDTYDAIAWFDKNVVDGAVNGVARLVRVTAGGTSKAQNGNVRNYAGIVGVGVVLLLVWFVVGRGMF